MKILKRTDSHEPTDRRFQGALHVAAGLLGWLVPDTDAAVKATSLDDEDVHGELPDELKDPFAILDRAQQNFAPVPCCDASGITADGIDCQRRIG
jgi:hypothetical protein